jgi:hypothetical protein
MASYRERLGVHGVGSRPIDMHTHSIEAASKTRFEQLPRRWLQRTTGGRERVLNLGRSVHQLTEVC